MNNPVAFQRVEGLALFASSTFVYFHNDLSWVLYILLLFAFDFSMLGYLVNSRFGAVLYNLGHSLIIPTLLSAVCFMTNSRTLLGLICIWFAHIGMDRVLGYGLKLSSGFRHTHLGDIGKS